MKKDNEGRVILQWSAACEWPHPGMAYIESNERGFAWVRGNGLGVVRGSVLRVDHHVFGADFEVFGVEYLEFAPGAYFMATVRPYFGGLPVDSKREAG